MVLRAGMTEGLRDRAGYLAAHLVATRWFSDQRPVYLFHLGRRKTHQSLERLEQLGGRLSSVAWPSPQPGRSGQADDASEERTGLALFELMLF